MSTLAEEDPEYASAVDEYLRVSKTRRLPWGGIVVAGHVTMTRSFTERRERTELGETAIALLTSMGVSTSVLEELTDTLPWNATGDELIAKLQEVRFRQPMSEP